MAGTALGGLVMLRDDRDEEIVRSWLSRFGIRQEVTVMSEIEEVTDGSLVYAEPDGKDVTSYAGIDELEIELTGMGVRVMPYDESGGTAYDGENIIVDISGCREDLKDRISVSQGRRGTAGGNGTPRMARHPEQRDHIYQRAPREIF